MTCLYFSTFQDCVRRYYSKLFYVVFSKKVLEVVYFQTFFVNWQFIEFDQYYNGLRL